MNLVIVPALSDIDGTTIEEQISFTMEDFAVEPLAGDLIQVPKIGCRVVDFRIIGQDTLYLYLKGKNSGRG